MRKATNCAGGPVERGRHPVRERGRGQCCEHEFRTAGRPADSEPGGSEGIRATRGVSRVWSARAQARALFLRQLRCRIGERQLALPHARGADACRPRSFAARDAVTMPRRAPTAAMARLPANCCPRGARREGYCGSPAVQFWTSVSGLTAVSRIGRLTWSFTKRSRTAWGQKTVPSL